MFNDETNQQSSPMIQKTKDWVQLPELVRPKQRALSMLPVGARRSSRQLASGAGPARRPAMHPTLKTVLSDLTEIKRVLNENALLDAAVRGAGAEYGMEFM